MAKRRFANILKISAPITSAQRPPVVAGGVFPLDRLPVGAVIRYKGGLATLVHINYTRARIAVVKKGVIETTAGETHDVERRVEYDVAPSAEYVVAALSIADLPPDETAPAVEAVKKTAKGPKSKMPARTSVAVKGKSLYVEKKEPAKKAAESEPKKKETPPLDISQAASEKPLEDEKSGVFIRRLLVMDKYSDDVIAATVLANYANRKTTAKDVDWNRRQMKKGEAK